MSITFKVWCCDFSGTDFKIEDQKSFRFRYVSSILFRGQNSTFVGLERLV